MAPPHPQQPEEESDRGHGRTPDWFVGYPPIRCHQGDGPKESDQQRSLAQGVPIGISKQRSEHRQDELALRNVPSGICLEILGQKNIANLDQENDYEASKRAHLLLAGLAGTRSHGIPPMCWPANRRLCRRHLPPPRWRRRRWRSCVLVIYGLDHGHKP